MVAVGTAKLRYFKLRQHMKRMRAWLDISPVACGNKGNVGDTGEISSQARLYICTRGGSFNEGTGQDVLLAEQIWLKK